MVAGPRLLTTSTLVDWIAGRLLLARTTGAPWPRWPPTLECLRALADGRDDEALLLPDARGARYVITAHLRGDTPHVFLAREHDLDREVVIKLIWASDEAAVREARLTATLAHPNIVAIHEVDPAGRYLVLERLDADLRDLSGMRPELVLDAYCQTGRGLAAAHAKGIWHLDFKPENVLIHLEQDHQEEIVRVWAKVADFGLAMRARASALPRATRLYEAPERGLPGAAGDLADQYSFAVALWESLAAGERPPGGALMIPAGLREVLERALCVDPLQRWPNMTELVNAIEHSRDVPAVVGLPSEDRRMEWGQSSLDKALAQAEDGLFASARHSWSELQSAMAAPEHELGFAGLALGEVMLSSADQAEETASARGYLYAIAVLDDAIRYLSDVKALGAAAKANRLALEGCERWMTLYPDSSSLHRDLERLRQSLRRRSAEREP